ncbi:acetyltransferase [Methylobacter luteus]|uniref:acetyltransferase n=1 Tax=Methylobacter luteus TaxID=415 RepID=UPI000404A083|nr:acetyltransferase [Methylobacter luteus]
MNYDVFNGDADGICALLQLRLAEPKSSVLVTGIKRDIELLDRVNAKPGDDVTVLDVSLQKNLPHVQRILQQGARIFYVDHHLPGEIPEHAALKTLIDTDANMCTSLLVDRYLQGQYRSWAVVAAFGDNLNQSAEQAAGGLKLSASEIDQLKELGICINYNSYGSCVEDLHYPPDQLYKSLLPYKSPLDFIGDQQSIYKALQAGYYDDLMQASRIKPEYDNDHVAVIVLPDKIWARRINGVYGNELANQAPAKAHAIVTHNNRGGYQVSVRAPLVNKAGADELCSEFPSGGGRKGAAGINHLPVEQLTDFIKRFSEKYG